MNVVSRRLPLIDGPDKVTGALRFAADMPFEGALEVKLLLSPRAHARIVDLDAGAALATPGVVAVFWHANAPHCAYNSSIWAAGQSAPEDETMFPKIVRHVGDRVAAIVAETGEIAEAAAAKLRVVYEDLPAVFDPALGETVAETEFVVGDVERAFATAAVVVASRVSTPKTHHAAIETHVAVAAPSEGGRVTVWSPCQSVFAVQAVVAKALGLEAERIRAVKTPVGGSFGGKAEPILEPLAAFMALHLGKPVRIVYDRRESCLATRARSRAIAEIRTALNADGRIVARETKALIDVGAYCTGGHYLPGSMAQRLSRLYGVPNKLYSGRAVLTNTPPTGAFRGYGTPQINAITEINLDLAARALGADPLRLRLRNVVRPGASEPYQGLDVGNARIRDCLILGARAFGWTRRRRAAEATGRTAIGVGLAAATHINGCYPDDEGSTVEMALKPGGRVALGLALHDLGNGALTTLAQIAAEALGAAPETFDVAPADSDLHAYDLGTRASRMTYVCGEAVRRTGEILKAQIQREAARLMNCAADDLELADGALRGSQGRLSLAELVEALAARGDPAPAAMHSYAAVANPGSYAAHFAEVAVDRLTGRVKVQAYLAAHDVGRAINPMLVEGQIHGGVQIGIGYALYEDVDIDLATGRMRGDRFGRYHLANAPELPRIATLLIEKGEPTGPYGAKAVGEIATVPVAAAIVNAVNHALGADLTDLPLTPEKICVWLDGREPL